MEGHRKSQGEMDVWRKGRRKGRLRGGGGGNRDRETKINRDRPTEKDGSTEQVSVGKGV